jgi:hypothetical protein
MSSLPLSTTMGDSFHTQMTKVYVSGPMTGYPDYNFPAFHGMEAVLSALGYHTLNPARNFNGEHGHPREDYMRLDIQNVLQADAVVMLPGWTQSVGARTEVMVAHQLGLPLFEARYVDNEQVEFTPVEDLTGIGLENPVPARRGHPDFYRVLAQMADVHERKNHDYSSEKDTLSNLRSPIDGIPDWITSFVRLGDKVGRVRGFAERTMRDGVATMAVKDESVEDTLIDLANYAILTLILYRENRA